jgi:hypothetical protein
VAGMLSASTAVSEKVRECSNTLLSPPVPRS